MLLATVHVYVCVCVCGKWQTQRGTVSSKPIPACCYYQRIVIITSVRANPNLCPYTEAERSAAAGWHFHQYGAICVFSRCLAVREHKKIITATDGPRHTKSLSVVCSRALMFMMCA